MLFLWIGDNGERQMASKKQFININTSTMMGFRSDLAELAIHMIHVLPHEGYRLSLYKLMWPPSEPHHSSSSSSSSSGPQGRHEFLNMSIKDMDQFEVALRHSSHAMCAILPASMSSFGLLLIRQAIGLPYLRKSQYDVCHPGEREREREERRRKGGDTSGKYEWKCCAAYRREEDIRKRERTRS
jgi:hypothetical protein